MAETSLYDGDIYAWSRQQAEALRALAQRHRDLPNELDLAHIAEEVEDMGRSELRAVKSALRRILIHLIKFAFDPGADARRHWLGEILTFHRNAKDAFAPSMTRNIDLDALWREAWSDAVTALAIHGHVAPGAPPVDCPFELSDMLADKFDPRVMLIRLEGLLMRPDPDRG